MQPVLTPAQMRALDAKALESGVGLRALIDRAGHAVAIAARRLLGRVAGERIIVFAGPGNNGADGVSAARVLDAWGAAVTVVDVAAGEPVSVPRLPGGARPALVIDAVFGTGYRVAEDRPAFGLPDVGAVPVLAVDIVSGVDGLTGRSLSTPQTAVETVTFVAPKPGNLLADGRRTGGRLTVVDLGFASLGAPTPSTSMSHLEPNDGAVQWPRRSTEAHKWRAAVLVVGGSAGMSGAAVLASTAAARTGAGHVSLGVLDPQAQPQVPVDVIARPIDPHDGWRPSVGDLVGRVGAIAIGPGLATDSITQDMAASLIAESEPPLVLDAGALDVVAARPDLLRRRHDIEADIEADVDTNIVVDGRGDVARRGGVVLTPHDGEFERLSGERPGTDRVASTLALAERLGAVVLLKGPTTIVADAAGEVRLVTSGDQRLATAGSGDVLTGVIASGLAQGLSPLDAAALGAHLHGEAASHAPPAGLVASDLPQLIARTLAGRP